ncbi:predicted protein [Botrytis cinerea T4]|uniref:Uncharacterized protein n=1 Tax=Botryotinia fuckeliana (strain T4) TaxID=999810 RepID=G2YR44_BOTF4|nr:predicted protein [Botrytis cinerea T4]
MNTLLTPGMEWSDGPLKVDLLATLSEAMSCRFPID